MDQKEAVSQVIGGLSYLILSNARMTASEQYCPSSDPDKSDDVIKERRALVRELRELRERFENAVTGVIL